MKYLLLALAAVLLWYVLKGRSGASGMSVGEACRVLGVSPADGADAILEAHRKLIAKVHPDTGGTAELAARVHEARDVLLKRIS